MLASLNVAENKATASGAACKYLKCPLVPAFLTTALLASAATASMGPDVSFLKNPHPSNFGIEVYNN